MELRIMNLEMDGDAMILGCRMRTERYGKFRDADKIREFCLFQAFTGKGLHFIDSIGVPL